jgi:hypothetical protein
LLRSNTPQGRRWQFGGGGAHSARAAGLKEHTEALLLLVRLYRRLGASDTDQVTVVVRHAGLLGREPAVANSDRIMMHHPEASADESETTISTTLIDLETNIAPHVRAVIDPLLVLFDFYDVNPEILDDISEGFVAGEVR